MFDPKCNKFPYPVQTDKHYITLKKDRGIVFDREYPYVDKSPAFRFKSFLLRLFLCTIVFPVVRVRLGLRIKGKENLKKHKDIIKNGVVSCANHIHMWDYLGVMIAIKPIKPNVLIWAANINGEWGKMMRLVGGIPIPENDRSATRAYMKAVKKLTSEGNWLHIYPEGSMWEYYRNIRPFKKGVAYVACECDKPVLPMAFTYREAGFIRRRIFGQIACLTLNIGEPIFADKELPKKEMRDDLTTKAHEAVCCLAGIKPEDNLYPAIFDESREENSKRVDYYTDTYGVGYKGSW